MYPAMLKFWISKVHDFRNFELSPMLWASVLPRLCFCAVWHIKYPNVPHCLIKFISIYIFIICPLFQHCTTIFWGHGTFITSYKFLHRTLIGLIFMVWHVRVKFNKSINLYLNLITLFLHKSNLYHMSRYSRYAKNFNVEFDSFSYPSV